MKKASVADRILERLEGFAEALERGDAIKEKFTCRQVILDLEVRSYTPQEVRQIRDLLGASQAVFARLLGVSAKSIQSWEQGTAEPGGMASRWLAEIQRDPPYWLNRLKEAMVQKPVVKSRRSRQTEA